MVSQDLVPIRVHPKAHSAILGGHPWVIRDSLTIPAEPITLGTEVLLVGPDGKSLARGLYNPTSRIAVRVYSRDARQTLDEAFFLRRLDRALKLRQLPQFGNSTNAVRLVFSEGDSLSGLIVDRYGSHIVVQQTAAVLTSFIPKFIQHLQERFSPDSIRWMVDEGVAKLEGIDPQNICAFGTEPQGNIDIIENGLQWQVDLMTGQKTGYYLDQRDNRAAVGKWLPENADVLDVCCYEGGFAITIAAQRPDCNVMGLDSSARALAAAKINAEQNGLANVHFESGDFIRTLQSWNSLNSDAAENNSASEAMELASEPSIQSSVGFSVGSSVESTLESPSESAGQSNVDTPANVRSTASPTIGAKRYFDCIVLDPPKLAGSRDSIDRALRAYHRLNYLAVNLLKPGGILVTCSCSGRVSHEDFQWMLRGVARQSRRSIQILERRGPSPDHPVNAACPETDYLKCYICSIGEVESSKAFIEKT